MDLRKRTFWIAVTGPESAGKSTLCSELSAVSNWPWVEEAARHHPLVLASGGQCSKDEIGEVWACQIQWALAADQFAHLAGKPGIILDTWALVPEVWTEEVHNATRNDTENLRALPDAYILCAPVLPWVPDPLRSIPDDAARWKLFHRYLEKVQSTKRPHCVYVPESPESLPWRGKPVPTAHKKSTPEACFFECAKSLSLVP